MANYRIVREHHALYYIEQQGETYPDMWHKIEPFFNLPSAKAWLDKEEALKTMPRIVEVRTF